MDEYGKAVSQLGQACCDGVLQAYAGVRGEARWPVIDSKKNPKVPMWPPQGVDQLDPQYIRRDVWVKWDWSRFFEWDESDTMDVPASDFSKLNQTAYKHVKGEFRRKGIDFFEKVDLDDPKDVFSKTLYLKEYEFRSDYKTRDYLEFPFNFEDFARFKSHLAALTIKPKTDSDLPKNLCECMEGFTRKIRFRYFARHCPYITTGDLAWDDLLDSALKADYKLQIGAWLFKREEVEKWLGESTNGKRAVQNAEEDAEANITAWTEILPTLRGADYTAAEIAICKWKGMTHVEAYDHVRKGVAIGDGSDEKAVSAAKRNYITKRKNRAGEIAKRLGLTMPPWRAR